MAPPDTYTNAAAITTNSNPAVRIGTEMTSALQGLLFDSIQGISPDVLRNASRMINRSMASQFSEHHDNGTNIYDLFDSVRHENIITNLALGTVFSLIVLVSLFGNSLVVYVIIRNKRMHTVTNAFITNLAICDLLITCLNIPFNIIRYMIRDWPFGDAMCHLINYVQTISVYAFTFTLISIALDRYMVIMYPLRPRISMCVAMVVVTIVWILASVLSIPFGLWYGQKSTPSNLLMDSTRCTKIFPNRDVERYVYLATTISQYVVPLLIITIVYGRIAQHLWVRVTLGHVTRDQQASHMKSKRKSIKMLITVVLAFAVCWFPLNCYYLILHFPPPDYSIKHSGEAVFSCYWVAMSSVSVNPFIYSWFNEAFRAEVLNRFRCCFKQRRIHPGYEIDGIFVRSDQVRNGSRRWGRGSERTLHRSSDKVPFPGRPANNFRRLGRGVQHAETKPIYRPSTAVEGEQITEYCPVSDQIVPNGISMALGENGPANSDCLCDADTEVAEHAV